MNDTTSIAWTETSRRPLLETSVFEVQETTSRSPQGDEAHFTVLEARDWGIVIPVLEDEEGLSFLMVRQWRHGAKRDSLEFPGGVIEQGEAPADGVRRELLEETGYRCKRLELLASLSPNPAIMANTVHIFAARGLEYAGEQQLDEHEYLHVQKVREEDAVAGNGKAPYIHALMTAALGLWISKRDRIFR